MMISVFDRVENIVGKGENAGTLLKTNVNFLGYIYLAFPPFPTIFSKGCLLGVIKCQDCVVNS